MCGNAGVAGKVKFQEEKAFKNLLVLDSLRGEHSTGIAAINRQLEVDIAKCVGDPYMLFDTKASESIFKQFNHALIGHNRFATTGKVNRKNAHPFEFDNLVGTHNGTLSNKHAIPNHINFDVDSEALFNHISNVGLKEAMGLVKGAWALVWWDKKNNSMNFLRNKERTLFYCYSEDSKTIFWASEAWMLVVALSRNNIKHTEVKPFEENHHYEFKVDTFKEELIIPPTITVVKGAPEVEYVPKKASTPLGGDSSVGPINPLKGVIPILNREYLGTESKFRIIGENKDEDGCEYIELIDCNNYAQVVRHYFHKETHLRNKKGYSFNGKIVGVKLSKSGFYFFKVEVKSPLFIEKVKDKQEKKELSSVTKKDKNGNEISAPELESYYHTCAWCNSPVDHKDDNLYINKETGVICSDCKSDPTVATFL